MYNLKCLWFKFRLVKLKIKGEVDLQKLEEMHACTFTTILSNVAMYCNTEKIAYYLLYT